MLSLKNFSFLHIGWEGIAFVKYNKEIAKKKAKTLVTEVILKLYQNL